MGSAKMVSMLTLFTDLAQKPRQGHVSVSRDDFNKAGQGMIDDLIAYFDDFCDLSRSTSQVINFNKFP